MMSWSFGQRTRWKAALLAASCLGLSLSLVGCPNSLGSQVSQSVNGTVIIDPTPDEANAPWSIVGPASFSDQGQGDRTFSSMEVGVYSIVWGEVVGYALDGPAEESLTLMRGGDIAFEVTYTDTSSQAGGGMSTGSVEETIR